MLPWYLEIYLLIGAFVAGMAFGDEESSTGEAVWDALVFGLLLWPATAVMAYFFNKRPPKAD